MSIHGKISQGEKPRPMVCIIQSDLEFFSKRVIVDENLFTIEYIPTGCPPSNSTTPSEFRKIFHRVENHASDDTEETTIHIEMENYSDSDVDTKDAETVESKAYKQIITDHNYSFNELKHKKSDATINQVSESLKPKIAQSRNYKCLTCGRAFSKENTLIQHKLTHEPKEDLECQHCKKHFTSKSVLEHHEQIHYQEITFECEECGDVFYDAKSLKLHENIHANKNFVCTKCCSGFDTEELLTDHTNTEHVHFKCQYCEKTYKREYLLRKHTAIHTGAGLHKCKVCDISFPNGRNLKNHMFTHTKNYPFNCAECGRHFTLRSSWIKHKMIHQGIKPFKCKLCPYSGVDITRLKIHERTHTREKDKKCTLCGKMFAKDYLETHISMVHSREKRYSCSICRQGFYWLNHLNEHMLQHMAPNPTCPTCGRKFVTHKRLKIHSSAVHGIVL